MSNKEFAKEEIRLFEMIAGSLSDLEIEESAAADADPEKVYALAAGHGILPIVYEPLSRLLTDDGLKQELAASFRKSTLNFYQLLRGAGAITGKLSEQGIPAVLLKGASVARLYPVPEARRSTDMDILLADPKDLEKARKVLMEAGCTRLEKKPGDPNHHEEWITPEKRMVELHLSVTEPFDDKELNRRIQEIFYLKDEEIHVENVLGTRIPMLRDDLLALSLLLHMRMDFLRSGFGLKLLCDWVVLWNRGMDKACLVRFVALTAELGLLRFLSAVTKICEKYLGLSPSPDVLLLQREVIPDELVDELLNDVVETERNGKPGPERMVALRGNSFFDYVREFHHQTVLTYPRAAKLIFPLPVLYVVVYFRFMFHAKTGETRRNVSDVMKSASSRGQLAKNL